jgi:hypothetical protein
MAPLPGYHHSFLFCRKPGAQFFPGHVHFSCYIQKGTKRHRPGGRGAGPDGHHRAGEPPDPRTSARTRRSGLDRTANLDLTFLGLLTYIGVIAAIVQILEMVLDRYLPALYATLGIFCPC